jgi:hypothetical protein
VHRVKIKVIQDVFVNYPNFEKLIYLDSDVILLSDLSNLFNEIQTDQFLMHDFEGFILNKSNRIIKKTYNYIIKNSLIEGKNESYFLSVNDGLWNAGVLGLLSSHNILLNDVLDLVDNMHPSYTLHITEQFSFNYFFQRNGYIYPANREVFHYWNLKEFRAVLSTFFSNHLNLSVSELMAKMDTVNPQKASLDKIKFYQYPGLVRAILRSVGLGWKLTNYFKTT